MQRRILLVLICLAVAGIVFSQQVPESGRKSLSFYHGLTTGSYIDSGGQKINFDYPAYLEYLGRAGVRRTRVFCDLPWFWRRDIESSRFNPAFAVLPYRRTDGGWDFDSADRLNPAFVERIRTGGEIARKYGMEILLCFATAGPDYDCPFFAEMGFRGSRDEYYRPGAKTSRRAWRRFLQYFGDIAEMTVPYKDVYVYYEPYNEYPDWFGFDRPHREIAKAVAKGERPDFRLQLNLPSPLRRLDTEDLAARIRRLRAGGTGFRVSRFSFHGVFTPDEVRKIAARCRELGLPLSAVELSTDGATPWMLPDGSFRFTREDSRGHYQVRHEWDDSEENRQGVTGANAAVVNACIGEGFAVCDIQDVSIKYDDRSIQDPEIQRLHQTLLKDRKVVR